LRKITLLTNERSVKNWCVKEDIKYADLPDLLRACWQSKVMSKKEVKTLTEEIEEKDNHFQFSLQTCLSPMSYARCK